MSIIFDDERCMQRALYTAFRYAGVRFDKDIPSNEASLGRLEKIAKEYNLSFISSGTICTNNRPVLIVYKTDRLDKDGKPIYHAVFQSDIGNHVSVCVVVLGWEKLHEKSNNL